MTTAVGSLQIVPKSPPSAPALRAADRGVAEALESVLSDNTKRVYQTPVEAFRRVVRRRGPAFPARRTPHRRPLTWPSVPAPAPASPPCAWPPPPSPRYTNGPTTNPPAGTGACARR